MAVENLPVPLDRRVWLEATTLSEHGYEVSVVCPMGRGWDAAYEEIEGVAIHRFPEPPEAHSGAFAYGREYAHALRHMLRLAREIHDRRGFDLIHGCNPPDLLFLLARRLRRRGVGYLFDHHDVSPELFEAKFGAPRGLKLRALGAMLRRLERASFREAAVSIATNESFRRIAIERGGMDPRDVFVVRSAPRVERFRPGPADPAVRRGASLVMGYVGVIGQQEGMDLLVAAADHLVRGLGHGDARFVVVGFGPALEAVRADVAARGLGEHFEFTGALYGDELLRVLNSCDLGVAPDPKNAMNDISTMNKVMEYMTLELPVVQFDLAEGRASAGDASLYAAPNDPRDFAACIARLAADPALRRRMGEAGRARVLERLSWDASVPPLLAAYDRAFEKLLGQPRRHGA
jgi:glycosyltransferase involved in cell wall biosynthesis